jgi:hypothetical protein
LAKAISVKGVKEAGRRAKEAKANVVVIALLAGYQATGKLSAPKSLRCRRPAPAKRPPFQLKHFPEAPT